MGQWFFALGLAAFVPGYSGGAVTDLHRLPLCYDIIVKALSYQNKRLPEPITTFFLSGAGLPAWLPDAAGPENGRPEANGR